MLSRQYHRLVEFWIYSLGFHPTVEQGEKLSHGQTEHSEVLRLDAAQVRRADVGDETLCVVQYADAAHPSAYGGSLGRVYLVFKKYTRRCKTLTAYDQ